ncbi:MAG: hypoxanthine phosphoribosyltransferase [Myxococcales bacterium]|nr:hypoxanthine phosphoribosyltransferase [Myxococcales bacterium]
MLKPRVLFDAATLAARVQALGAQITHDYRDVGDLVVVPILKGSFLFASDLIRHIDHPLSVEFLGLRSYGAGTESSGVVQITYDLTTPIMGKDVLIVEDIVDTGLSMQYLFENLATRRPRSVKLCALMQKPARTRVKVDIDYLGFTIDDHFVVGYGLDFDEKYRNLPYIGVIEGG